MTMKKIATMLCLTWMTSLTQASLIAYWNFNTSATAVSGGAESGTASLDTSGAALADITGAGTTQNRVGSDTGSTPLRITPGGTTAGENGQYITFSLSMSGYQDLVLSYATTRTSTGFTDEIWSYSTDDSTFAEFATINGASSIPLASNPTSSSYAVNTVDFSTASSPNNDSTIWIRLTLNNASGTTGADRFDNIQFNADAFVAPVPEPAECGLISTLALLGICGVSIWRGQGTTKRA